MGFRDFKAIMDFKVHKAFKAVRDFKEMLEQLEVKAIKDGRVL